MKIVRPLLLKVRIQLSKCYAGRLVLRNPSALRCSVAHFDFCTTVTSRTVVSLEKKKLLVFKRLKIS
jgi:hypothetical protein